MWRGVYSPLVINVILVVATFFDHRQGLGGVDARYFSEASAGGSSQAQAASDEYAENLGPILEELYGQQLAQQQNAVEEELAEMLQAGQGEQQQQGQQAFAPEEEEAAPSSGKDFREQLEELSNQLRQLVPEQQQQQQQQQQQPQPEPQQGDFVVPAGIPITGPATAEVAPLAVDEPKTPAAQPTAQKKGQSEFVEFVEPAPAKLLKAKITEVDKRVVAEKLVGTQNHGLQLFSSFSNVMFIAIVTVCSVFVVVGVVGGTYYYNNVRRTPDNNFDDFTRYSPAGPSKKLASLRTNGIRMDENGDDSLAYKAQLHHYQQTKQKIIGGEDGLGGTTSPSGGSPRSIHHSANSEDEADDLEEHNYSVYECPGLAPTGDIEVQNPNFGH